MAWRDHVPEPWTSPQRVVILLFLAGLLIYGSVRLLLNRAYVSNPQPVTPARAADIVAYRERYVREHPGDVAFKSLEDLLKIRGIGVATIEQLRPYLIFPKPNRPATQP